MNKRNYYLKHTKLALSLSADTKVVVVLRLNQLVQLV